MKNAQTIQTLPINRTRRSRFGAATCSVTANPKRLAELAATLAELRDWAWLEARTETEESKQQIWLDVRDWAVGAAIQNKLNLDLVPLALKTHTANGGMVSETTRPGGDETASVGRRDESPNAGTQPPPG